MISKIIDEQYYKSETIINPLTFEPEVNIYVDKNFIDMVKINNIVSRIYIGSNHDINYNMIIETHEFEDNLLDKSGTTNSLSNLILMMDYFDKSDYSVMNAHIEMANRYINILQPIENIDIHLDKVSNKNLLWMANKISTGDMLTDKASRWLGYIQGVMATKGYISVDQERDFSRPLYHLAYGNMNLDIPKSEECDIK